MTVRVLLADDQPLVRGGFAVFVNGTTDLEVVGQAATGREAVELARATKPDVVVMDIRMPGMDGIECARRLKNLLPRLVVIFVTGLLDDETMRKAIKSGSDGYLVKPLVVAQLLATLSFCIPCVKFQFAEQPLGGGSGCHRGLSGRSLTAREKRLMEYMDAGLLYKEIADRTGVSESAVHHMQSRIFRKLGVMNKIEALRKWKERGAVHHELLDPGASIAPDRENC